MDDQRRFERLLRAGHRCLRIVTHEEAEAMRLVRDAAMGLGLRLLTWTAVRGVGDGLVGGSAPVPETENAAAGLHWLARTDAPAIIATLDLAAHLRDDRALRAWRELLVRLEDLADAGMAVHLVMVDCQEAAPPVVAAAATRFDLSPPAPDELERIVREVLRAMHRRRPVRIGLTRAGLDTIIRNLRGLSRRQARLVVADAVADDQALDLSDLNRILAAKRRMLAHDGLLEYIEAPVSLDQVGGLRRLKSWLARRGGAGEARAERLDLPPPRGVLLLGVQGSGKSLCAKAIATAWGRPLLRMDAGALYDRYIGESERRLRDALRQAEAMAPIILWIDEIEKAFASAASHSTDGGLSKRMFATLLTWMQEHREEVFLVATANDIEALPPELLRKGRFDEIFFVDLPGPEARRAILDIHLRRRRLDPAALDLDALVAASDGHSGAEIEAAVVSALVDSFDRGSTPGTADLERALRDSPPLSVTMAESVEALRAWARGRCVQAD
jgi:MoxR-like ATPase